MPLSLNHVCLLIVVGWKSNILNVIDDAFQAREMEMNVNSATKCNTFTHL